ncbi:hypothetical protein ABWI13_08390, partial [Streptomyces koyangensis]|uniref:hypothetical protein n=1 Tax=Streptomyces koyangensis TaxID=188770 RepID=UPI0033934E77
TTSPSPDKPAVRTTASPIPEATRRSFAGQPLGRPEQLREVLGQLVDDRSGRVVQTNPRDLPRILEKVFVTDSGDDRSEDRGRIGE